MGGMSKLGAGTKGRGGCNFFQQGRMKICSFGAFENTSGDSDGAEMLKNHSNKPFRAILSTF
jgi:hypothetical protein